MPYGFFGKREVSERNVLLRESNYPPLGRYQFQIPKSHGILYYKD